MAGWYPDGRAGLRWWNGAEWTDDRVVQVQPANRRNRRSTIGAALLVLAGPSVVVAGLAVMGDPWPMSRVGVSRSVGKVILVNAVCPREQVRAVTLSRPTNAGPFIELWHISGSAPLPQQMQIGKAPTGMREVTELQTPITDDEPLSLRVRTDELKAPYSMEFKLADVPGTGVLSLGHVYPTVEEFERFVLERTPCGDPYSKKGPETFFVIMIVFALTSAAVGIWLIVRGRRK
jgi:hypothetical protein